MDKEAPVDFGARLRQAREDRGISLTSLAATTKISKMTLEALERNDHSRLPGGIFTRAFIRAYSAEVGIDPEPIVRAFLEAAAEQPLGRGSQPTPGEPGGIWELTRRASGAVLRLAGVVAPVIVVIAYLVFSGRGCADRDTPRPPVARPVTATPSQPAGTPPSAASLLEGAAPGPDVVRSDVPPPPDALEETASGDTLQMVIECRALCWVSASLDGGVRTFTRLMQPGERAALGAADQMWLTVGDAGAFSFTLNRRPGRSLGQSGQTARILITARNYESFLAQ